MSTERALRDALAVTAGIYGKRSNLLTTEEIEALVAVNIAAHNYAADEEHDDE